jgi:hypothetical protein
MKLVYDIVSVPKGLDISNLVKIFENHHVVFWDSKNDGTKPRIYDDKDVELPICIVDMEGKELDVAKYDKIFADDEFWTKELHLCKASPLYFFNNYGTTKWPAEDADITRYLLSIGLTEIKATDSDEAAKLWEIQKATTKKTTDTYTLELLKDRQPAVEALKAIHFTRVLRLEEKVKEHIELFNSVGEPLDEKKRIARLADKIKHSSPVLPEYSEKYRNSRGKWDAKMLFNTSYGVLLEMFDAVHTYKNRDKIVVPTKSK